MAQNELLGYLRDAAQGASNSAASTVSGPVDLLAWLLKKGGVPVGEAPLGGSAWMAQKGLTAQPQNALAGMAGETIGNILPIVAAAKAPQIANALLRAGENAAARPMLNPQTGAIVWHGSPHKFDAFDSAHIGKGEGAQAYGHGHYTADAKEVGEAYRNSLANSNPTALQYLRMWGNDRAKAAKAYAEHVKAGAFGDSPDPAKVADTLGAIKGENGYLYKVDLPDEAIARMLDWDKPLSQQAPEVQKHFEPMVAPIRAQMAKPADPGWGDLAAPSSYDPTGQELLSLLRKKDAPQTAQQFLSNGLGQDVSAMLRQQGIPGIRYLDGGSRGAGSGTSNYVVFPGEENMLRIMERNGVPLGK